MGKIQSKHSSEKSGVLTNFSGGLNRSVPPFLIGQNDLYDATNFYYDPTTGYLTTRPGLKRYSSAAIGGKPTGIFPFYVGNTLKILVAGDDQKLYYLDGSLAPQVITNNLSSTGRPSFAVCNKLVSVATGGQVQTWDGNTGHALTATSGGPNQNFIAGMGQKNATRIMGVGDPTYFDRLLISATNDPTTLGPTDSVTDSTPKYVDVGFGDGLSSTVMGNFRNMVVVFKRTAQSEGRAAYILNLNQNFTYWTMDPLRGDNAPLNPFLMKELYKSLYFIDTEGPKRLDVVESMADLPFDYTPTGTKIAGNMRTFVDKTGWSCYDKNFGLWMVKPNANSDTFYCMDILNDRWTWFRFGLNITAAEYCNGLMLFGADDGYLYCYDTTLDTDNGASYPKTVESKWFMNYLQYEEIMKERYIYFVGLLAGTMNFNQNVQGQQKMTKTKNFGSTWDSWALVNTLTPAQWNESLTKTSFESVTDHNVTDADFMSFQITVTSGLCALAMAGATTAISGRK